MTRPPATSFPPARHEDALSALAEAMPALVFVTDADGRVLQSNRRWREYTGQDGSIRPSPTWLSWVHAHDRSRALAAWSAAMAQARAVEVRLRLSRSGGDSRWFDCRGVPVHVDDRIDGWTFTACEALDAPAPQPLRAESWYLRAFEHAAVGLARVAANGRFLAANDCLCRMLGYSRARLLAGDAPSLMPLQDMASGGEARETREAGRRQGATDPGWREQRWLRADGTALDVMLLVERVPGEAGAADDFICVVEDITQRKARERALAEHDAMLQRFVDSMPVAVALFDRDMRYLAWSQQYLAELGLPADAALLGRSHYDVLPEVPRQWREIHAHVLQGQAHCSEAQPFHRPDGSTDWVRWAMRPWGRRSGAIDGAVLFFEVVTARMLTERAQQASLQRLRETEARERRRAQLLTHCLDAVPFPVWAKDAHGRWLLANAAAATLLTPAPRASPGHGANGARPALQINREEEERVLHEGATVRWGVEVCDPGHGTPRHLLAGMVPMGWGNDGAGGLLGFAHDVTAPGALPNGTRDDHGLQPQEPQHGRPQSS